MINDARRKTSLTIIYTSHFIARVRKGCSRVACERELEIEHNWNILTALLWPSRCIFLVLLMLGSTPSGFPRAPSVGCGFSTPRLQLSGTLLKTALARRTQLNYIIVWRPLDLWNRIFNRHQAEITVMQFRGHSLPVHHSVVYHGNFSCSSHFISQFLPTRFPLITAPRMCHPLSVHHLEWHFWPGQKVKT